MQAGACPQVTCPHVPRRAHTCPREGVGGSGGSKIAKIAKIAKKWTSEKCPQNPARKTAPKSASKIKNRQNRQKMKLEKTAPKMGLPKSKIAKIAKKWTSEKSKKNGASEIGQMYLKSH